MSLGTLPQIRLSSRNAAGELRQHVLAFIRSSRPEPGSRLATEAEMVSSLKVSRSTVRRALDPLERDGWIDRRAGSGTFVGLRVREMLQDVGPPAGPSGAAGPLAPAAQLRVRRDRGIVRVAVLIFKIGDLSHDWYTPGILQGLDDASDANRVVVELLGDRDGDGHDIDAISRRLELSRPDVLIVLSNRRHHAFVIRDAQRLGIKCFVSGTPHQGLGLPGVSEDNRQATALAVGRLKEAGHQKMGLILPRLAEPWVFERLEAFNQAAGVGAHVHWTTPEIGAAGVDAASADALEQFVRGNALTAVVPSHLSAMLLLDELVRGRRLSVPGDVSVVSFEQDQAERRYLGLGDAVRVVFPLREMGRRLAAMARAAVGDEAMPATRIETLSATLEGKSGVVDVRN